MQLFKRIITAGFKGFYRNKTISIASIFILVVTLTIIANMFMLEAIFKHSVAEIKKKVDISIYLKNDVQDSSILAIKQKLQELPNVKEVVYITKEETLIKFKEDYKNDPDTLAALSELGANPFGPSFSVKANDTPDYEIIMSKINDDKILGDDYNSIDKINYLDIRDSITKLNSLVSLVEKFGIFVTIIFVSMSVMITYNTVRLAIFTFKEEIAVMKLVGASNMYIRGPFIVESAMYGIIASLISVLIMYPISSWLDHKTVTFFAGFSILEYFTSNIFQIFIVLCVCGIVVSTVSSLLAVRKYLNV